MLVAGADFGTQSVRVTLIDVTTGQILGSAQQSCLVSRSADEPLLATQSHTDQMQAFASAMTEALALSGRPGKSVAGVACATTGSSVIITNEKLEPVNDYYLWCDHRAYREAEQITQTANAENLEAIKWCGGTYSHEWGYAKLLHFLRNNPDLRSKAALALENCDMVTATLCGVRDADALVRSNCAMGHKWMWGEAWGGYPKNEFWQSIDPLLENATDFLRGTVKKTGEKAGTLCNQWAEQLGLAPGIAVAVGAFDAHWDAIATGAHEGDLVNVIGTSTCMIGVVDKVAKPVGGICGMVPGSVAPGCLGVEAGLSAVGDIFEAVARRCNTPLSGLSETLNDKPRKLTGLIRLPWDNGDRTILVKSSLAGALIGLDLAHTAADELQAAIEGTALHTRVIREHIEQAAQPFARIINGGGIPVKNDILNQIYADILNTRIHVPLSPTTGIGSCIFAAVAADIFPTVAAAQQIFCPELKIYDPLHDMTPGYEDLYQAFKKLYFAFGDGRMEDLGPIMALLRAQRLNQN